MPSSHTNNEAMQIRSAHPLIVKMKQVRKRHRKRLADVEACMRLALDWAFGTLKQIEQGRRPLPQLISPIGTEFQEWWQSWLRCVEASPSEQDELEEKLMLLVLGRLRQNLP
jgi:hypothetical protein